MHASAGDAGDGVQTARRHVHGDLAGRLLQRHHAVLERPGHERDGAVPACGRIAGVVEEHHAEIGAVVIGRGYEAAVHVGVAARLEHEQATHVIEVLGRIAPPLENRRALQRAHPAGDDPERLAGRVVVGDADRCPIVHGAPAALGWSSGAYPALSTRTSDGGVISTTSPRGRARAVS